METLVSEEADLLPVGPRHVTAACVEVAQQNDVLQGNFYGSHTASTPYMSYNLRH